MQWIAIVLALTGCAWPPPWPLYLVAPPISMPPELVQTPEQIARQDAAAVAKLNALYRSGGK